MEPSRDAARLAGEVGRLAHELANVLGIVQNYVGFLGEDLGADGDDAARRSLPPLESATARAVALVRELQHTVAAAHE
ncbi:MAG TPA: hypothetical protein VFY17_03540 [Pilimelia sp.]|nr:hypothetical protein [Pilimelia sp.]